MVAQLIQINHINKINDILLISSTNGLTINFPNQNLKILDNINVISTIIKSPTQFIVQTTNSFYLVTIDINNNQLVSQEFLFAVNGVITSSTIENNYIIYSLKNTDNLTLYKLNILTKNNTSLLIDGNSIFEHIRQLSYEQNKYVIITRKRILLYDPITNTITGTYSAPSIITSSLVTSTSILITNGDLITELDFSFSILNTYNLITEKINSISKNISLLVSTNIGLFDLTNNEVLTTDNIKQAIEVNGDIVWISSNLVESQNQIFYQADFVNNNLIPNIRQGFYKSKPINISRNNDSAAFSWGEIGDKNNFQVTLAASQSTDLINFTSLSNPSSTNKGVFIPNITPLTQAVTFELSVNLTDQFLNSPEIHNFKLTTNEKSLDPENPVNLKKAETLVTHTSYPQKFFAKSDLIRRHDGTFKKISELNDNFLSSFDESPYGFQYDFKSRVRDQFGQYSKESYNPLKMDYTKLNYPLSAAVVPNVQFTVLNPTEIFINWDKVDTLVDGTPIPPETIVTYKILRKDDSNAIYKTIYGDNLISLNLDYITSEEPINSDFKQLTDGVSGLTHNEDDCASIFIDPVNITFSLDKPQLIDKINLSFIKEYTPSRIQLKITNGSVSSEVFIFDNLDFTFDKENIQELFISDIGLFGNKIDILFELNDKEELKITEVEIYRGISQDSEPRTFYRDENVNFKEGSQYYYIVQAQLSRRVQPTQFPKETETIKLGNNVILGLTDAANYIYRLDLDENNNISNIIRQIDLPVKLQNLSAVILDKNVVTLGGKYENNSADLASGLTFLTGINASVLTEIISNNKGPFNVVAGVNDELIISIDKKNPITITFDPGINEASQIAFTINQILNASSEYGPTYRDLAKAQSKRVILSRSRSDLLNRIKIEDGSANKLLGFTNKDLGPIHPRIDMRSNKAYHTSWQIDNNIFVFGGLFDTLNKLPTDEILKSNISDDLLNLSLFDSVDTLPISLYGHSLASKDNWVYILGGKTENGTYSDKVYLNEYDTNTQSLTGWILTAALPEPLFAPTTQIIGEYIYLIGGKKATGEISLDIYRSVIDSNYRLDTWQKIGELPKSKYLASSFTFDNKIFIIGGKTKNERLSKEIYSFDVDLSGDIIDIYTEKQLPISIASSTLVKYENSAYLLGGEINSGYSLGQQIEIDPPDNTV